MKNSVCFILLFNAVILKSQGFNPSTFKFTKEVATASVSVGDTSHIYNVLVLTHAIGGITSFSLSNETYDMHDSAWVMQKDTSYSWNAIVLPDNGNVAYAVCRINDNILKVCIGRLYLGTRQRITFRTAGKNGTLIKEFIF